MANEIQLDPVEARVLGVLIEKEKTVPESYPLSLNALVNGANQKSNRHPVLSLNERQVNEAILKLRVAGLVEFVQLVGQRVEKYRHRAEARFALTPVAASTLAELLLRGPQQPGELRARVDRMVPVSDQAALEAVLEALAAKGLVRRHDPAPGERAPRWSQTLAPGAHELPAAAPVADRAATDAASALHAELARARAEIERLRAELEQVRAELEAARAGA